MPSTILLVKTLKQELINPLELIIITIISFFYFAFTILLLNYKLTTVTLLGDSSFSYKFKLLSALVFGASSPLGTFGMWLLIITSLLVGANIVVVLKNLRRLAKLGGRFVISAGGGALIGMFVAGCSSCGYSIFALVGLTAAVSLFPFEGTIIGFLIIVLLTASLIYSLNTLAQKQTCNINY
jgi:hypothetical protein